MPKVGQTKEVIFGLLVSVGLTDSPEAEIVVGKLVQRGLHNIGSLNAASKDSQEEAGGFSHCHCALFSDNS